MLNVVFEKVEEYNIAEEGCVGLEMNAMQQTLKYIFMEEMNKRSFFFSIKELKPNSTKSKSNRIKGLQPWFENGKIFLKKDQHELIDQITRYPKTRHDDVLDSLAHILAIMAPADVVVEDDFSKLPLTQNEKDIWQAKADLGKKRHVHRTKQRF
jgi:predicted phage terminase large subunit-like protein